jgi:hypothetical protein
MSSPGYPRHTKQPSSTSWKFLKSLGKVLLVFTFLIIALATYPEFKIKWVRLRGKTA